MNIVDQLISQIMEKKNPTVLGLDPDINKFPKCYKSLYKGSGNDFQETADIIFQFNKDIIDTVYPLISSVKPQIAFYEKYGSYGVHAFEQTVRYAHEKGLVVIEDGKRNDIGNTANAYAQAHLGNVELISGVISPSINADFLTVLPFLGTDSLQPFVDVCISNNKGVFILVKTSNPGSGEIQDIKTTHGLTISQEIANYVATQALTFMGQYGYSSIGAVVGATYPEEAKILRQMMPTSYFLVPGYGAQGGTAKDIIPCFNPDGLGAVVNSSRGLLYSHMSDSERNNCTKEEYLLSVYNATKAMQQEIYTTLKSNCPNMKY